MPPQKHILIVEDEQTIADRIHRLSQEILSRYSFKYSIISNVENAFELLSRQKIDLLLLDLNLNGEDGFQLLKKAVANDFQTIIVSANDHKAIFAFEYGVLDFVPKPFTKERLKSAFHRWMDKDFRLEESTKYLSVQIRGNIRLVEVVQLKYIKGAGSYSELFLKSGKRELHAKSLERLLQVLPAKFERIHRSYILNLDCLDYIQVRQGGKYQAVLTDGSLLPIGRNRYKELKVKWL